MISDAGWPGLVLKVAVRGIDERSEDDKTLFEVGAGEEWDRFVARAVARNCAGIECLSGIPGSVGGTPVQNVGAYGQEVAETVASVLTLDLKDGQIRELCAEACGFSYRTSIFNTSERGRFIILRVTYSLTPEPGRRVPGLGRAGRADGHPARVGGARRSRPRTRLSAWTPSRSTSPWPTPTSPSPPPTCTAGPAHTRTGCATSTTSRSPRPT